MSSSGGTVERAAQVAEHASTAPRRRRARRPRRQSAAARRGEVVGRRAGRAARRLTGRVSRATTRHDGDDPGRREHGREQDDRRRRPLEPGDRGRHDGGQRRDDRDEQRAARARRRPPAAARPGRARRRPASASPSRKALHDGLGVELRPVALRRGGGEHDHVAVVAQHVEAVGADLDRVGAAARRRDRRRRAAPAWRPAISTGSSDSILPLLTSRMTIRRWSARLSKRSPALGRDAQLDQAVGRLGLLGRGDLDGGRAVGVGALGDLPVARVGERDPGGAEGLVAVGHLRVAAEVVAAAAARRACRRRAGRGTAGAVASSRAS